MTNNTAIKNASGFGKAIVGILSAGEKAKSGAMSLVAHHADDMARLLEAFDATKDIDDAASIRSISEGFFFATPEGEQAARRIAELKGISKPNPSQKAEKETYKKRISAINTLLTSATDIYRATMILRDECGFTVKFVTVKGSDRMHALIMGEADDMPASFTAEQMKAFGRNAGAIRECTSYTDLQSLGKSGRAGTPNANAGAQDKIAPSKLGETFAAIDNSIAGLSFEKDGGMTPTSRNRAALLWARLNSELPQSLKDWAMKEIASDAPDAIAS